MKVSKEKQLTEYGQMLQHIETVTKYITDLEKEVNYLKNLCHMLAFMLQQETTTDLVTQDWLNLASRWLQDQTEMAERNGV